MFFMRSLLPKRVASGANSAKSSSYQILQAYPNSGKLERKQNYLGEDKPLPERIIDYNEGSVT